MIKELIFYLLRFPILVHILIKINDFLYAPCKNMEASNFMQKYEELDATTVNKTVLNVFVRKVLSLRQIIFNFLPSSTIGFIYNPLVVNSLGIIEGFAVVYLSVMKFIFTQFNEKWIMRNVGDENNRLKYIKSVLVDSYVEPELYPSKETLISFEGIDWFITDAVFVFDVLTRNCDGTFIIDTTFLNKYERHLEGQSVGAIGIFKLSTNGFVLQSLTYNGMTYKRTKQITTELYFALYAFYAGMLNYVTVCSHSIQSHFLISGQISNWNRKYLPCYHPLRRVLLPTELNTIPVLLKATQTILLGNEQGHFNQSLNFTDKGQRDMITDFIKESEYDYLKYAGENFMAWLNLTPLEMNFKPFKTYYKWNRIIRVFADNFVEELYSQNLVTAEILTWLSVVYPQYKTLGEKESIKRILGCMYYETIKHQMMSNVYLQFYITTFIPSLRKDKDNNYYTLFSQVYTLLVNSTTVAMDLPKLTMDLSFLVENNPKLQAIHAKLYNDVNTLDVNYEDNDLKLLKPSLVNISVGF